MKIQSYNKYELEEFVNSALFSQTQTLPISYPRATSQINNPYCATDDILLWVGIENNEVCGYIGVLPDLILTTIESQKIYWLSCFWISENFRNSVLASQLFISLIKAYGKNIFISNFLFSLEKTYQNIGIFQPTTYKNGYTFYQKLDFTDLIKAKFPKLHLIIPVYTFVEKLTNYLLKSKNYLFSEKLQESDNVFEYSEVTGEIASFLESLSGNKVIRKKEYFDWILSYPWIDTKIAESEAQRYYFSSKANKFGYKLIISKYNNTIDGFILLRIRDNNMHLTHTYITNSNYKNLTNKILEICKKNQIDSITSYNNNINNELSKYKHIFIIRKKDKQAYLLPKSFNFDSNIFEPGDGDSVFT